MVHLKYEPNSGEAFLSDFTTLCAGENWKEMEDAAAISTQQQ